MQKMKTLSKLSCVAVTALLASSVIAPSAQASQEESTDAALLAVGDLVTEQNSELTKSGDTFVTESGEYSIVVAENPEEALTLEDPAGDPALKVELPSAHEAGEGELSELGGVTYDNRDESTTTVLPKSDGSLQIATVIESKDAPHEYEYTISSGDGGSLVLEEDGSVSVFDESGEWAGGVAKPWAKDANGNDVPTEYKVAGNKLIQHVAFDNETAFPVVADPWLGISLISKTVWERNLWKYSPTLKVYPTTWGRYHVSAAARWAAWSETLSKTKRSGWPNPDTASMKNQFYCHFDVVRLRAPNKPYWGLDSKIPNRGYWGFVKNSCN